MKSKISKSKKIDYLDERSGYWTRCEISKDHVAFHRDYPNAHWFASAMTAMIAITLILGMLQNPASAVILFILTYFVFTTWRGGRIQDRKRFPMVIASDIDAAKADFENGRYFSKRNVRKFVVRENKNRDFSDCELVQIYMELKDSDYLVLLYQQYPTREATKKTEEIAEQLRTWLKAGR